MKHPRHKAKTIRVTLGFLMLRLGPGSRARDAGAHKTRLRGLFGSTGPAWIRLFDLWLLPLPMHILRGPAWRWRRTGPTESRVCAAAAAAVTSLLSHIAAQAAGQAAWLHRGPDRAEPTSRAVRRGLSDSTCLPFSLSLSVCAASENHRPGSLPTKRLPLRPSKVKAFPWMINDGRMGGWMDLLMDDHRQTMDGQIGLGLWMMDYYRWIVDRWMDGWMAWWWMVGYIDDGCR